MSHRLRLALMPLFLAASTALADDPKPSVRTLTGKDALGDFSTDAPGVRRKITVDDLATPYDTPSAMNFPRVSPRPEGAWPKAPAGFEVTEFAKGLQEPRVIVRAPNGDLFLSESRANRVRVLRDADGDGKPEVNEVFATGLRRPFGIAFYPLGPEPNYLYVGNTDSVVRLPYKNGDTKASGEAETIVKDIPSGNERVGGGGHWTRDLEFSPDGTTLYVSVGSRSNNDDDARENRRAMILAFDPDGKNERQFATGIRNPVGLATHPVTKQLWTSVNERDGLGRPPGARLHHARRERRLLRLAVVLHRLARGPAVQGEAPRVEGQDDCPGRAPPVAHGVDRPDVLRRRPIPEGVPSRRLRLGARLVEPRPPHRVQGHPRADERRQGDR